MEPLIRLRIDAAKGYESDTTKRRNDKGPGRSQNFMWQKAKKLFAFFPWRRSSVSPEVIVHDPSAAGPQDLDDVFRNEDVQRRVADLIAASKKKD
ncbi:MAG: hypothetical protein K2Y71_18110 [Xanthobacteraceae bacterium]|nr:hypothetical protein [Xanthobacteraceae bacterium]